jgi:hypothetical protein
MISKVAFTAIFALLSTSLFGEVVYSSMPSGVINDVTSVGYEASKVSEFGNAISLGGTDRSLTTVEVLLSDAALFSQFGGSALGFTHPITLSLYGDSVQAAAGPSHAFAGQTLSPTIAWAADASTPTSTLVTFNFSGVTLPETLIYGISFNTNTSGYNPIGTAGPYDSLNVAFGDGANPITGTNLSPDNAYVNASNPVAFESSTVAGVFGLDTNGGYSAGPSVEFDASVPAPTPEPGTFLLLGGALLVLGVTRRRKTRGSRN